MNFGIILQISRTHLLAKFRQSVIAALGVTFGIGMFIGMMSFMTGVNEFLDDLMRENTAHIRLFTDVETHRTNVIDKAPEYRDRLNVVHHVKPKDTKQNIRNAQQIIKLLKDDPRVYSVAPRLNAQVFYTFSASDINGVVMGIDVHEEDKLFELGDKMEEGALTDLLTINNGLVMGSGLAEKLAVDVNDRVNVTSTTGGQFQMKVVGIFNTGIAAIDDVQSYATLVTAQKLMQKTPDYITDINIELYDEAQAPELADEFAAQFNIKSEDLNEANANLEVGEVMRNSITYAVSITLLIVAGFGIYNILTMMIYDKMDDIAIMKATGFSGGDVMKIFISEALLIGTAGGLMGLVVGLLMSWGISKIPFETDEIITLEYMPVNFDPKFYFVGMLFAMATTFMAGYLPARKASKIDPVEIIRGK